MKRALVVKLSSLGDIAHALPAVRALKERVEGGIEIDWVAQPEYAGLLERCPDVTRVIPFPRRRFWTGAARFLRALRRDEYDVVLDLQGLLKSALPTMAARRRGRAPKIGPAWSREGASAFYTIQPVRGAGPRRHAVEELLDVVGLYAPPKAGEDGKAPRPRIDIEAAAGDTEGEETGPRVVLAPFSRWDTKNWPAERFAEAGKILAGEMGCRIFVLGGAGDREAGLRLAQEIPGARDVCGHFGLVEMCAFLKTADLMVSVDSGPLHWADAMGVPAVAVYGSTDPARTGPYFQPEAVVTAEGLPCRPCHSRQCARGDCACLGEVTAKRVAEAALGRL